MTGKAWGKEEESIMKCDNTYIDNGHSVLQQWSFWDRCGHPLTLNWVPNQNWTTVSLLSWHQMYSTLRIIGSINNCKHITPNINHNLKQIIIIWVFVKSRDPGKLPGYDAACTRLSSGWKIAFYCYVCPSRFTIIVYNVSSGAVCH